MPVLNFIKINDVDQSMRKCLKVIDRATASSIALLFFPCTNRKKFFTVCFGQEKSFSTSQHQHRSMHLKSHQFLHMQIQASRCEKLLSPLKITSDVHTFQINTTFVQFKCTLDINYVVQKYAFKSFVVLSKM